MRSWLQLVLGLHSWYLKSGVIGRRTAARRRPVTAVGLQDGGGGPSEHIPWQSTSVWQQLPLLSDVPSVSFICLLPFATTKMALPPSPVSAPAFRGPGAKALPPPHTHTHICIVVSPQGAQETGTSVAASPPHFMASPMGKGPNVGNWGYMDKISFPANQEPGLASQSAKINHLRQGEPNQGVASLPQCLLLG